jgi:PAS domain S-box-containing protein
MNFIDVMLLTCVGYLALFAFVWTRPVGRATVVFQLMLACSFAWASTYYLELTLPSLEGKVAAHLVRFLFLPWLPFLWLAALREVLGVAKGAPRGFWMLAGTYCVATMAVAITAPWHRWFQYEFAIFPLEGTRNLGILVYENGPWNRGFEFLNNLLLPPATLILMARAWGDASPIMRRQLLLLAAAYLVPIAISVSWFWGYRPVPNVNLTPAAMSVSIAILGWVVLGYRALDIVPVARGILLDTMEDLVFVWDAGGRLVDMNAAACAAVGRPLMDCVGKTAREMPAPWAAALGSGGALREVERAGIRKWYAHSAREIQGRGGTPGGVLATLKDVTSQREAELALAESEAELRLILDNIVEAVFIHDARGRLLAVNRPMLAMYGLEREEDALRYGIFEDYSAPESDFELAKSAVEAALRGERRTIPRWTSRRPATGETFEVRVELCSIQKGRERLVLATVMDLTEELAQNRREIEVQKLTEEKKFLRQQEMLIRDLHDGVGGILAGIGMLGALGMGATSLADKDEIFRKISDLAGEANVEVRSLMGSLETREFYWADLVTEMRRHASMAETNHGIEVFVKVRGEGEPGEPGLFAGLSLFRIFKEALNNAVKHSGAKRMDVELAFGPGAFAMDIQDNGRGFPADLPRGRGLRNMRQRIRELGGEMEIASGAGGKLSFRAALPLKSPDKGMDASPDGRV